jgi:hypothetical protein
MLNHYSLSITAVKTFVEDVMFQHWGAKTRRVVGREGTLNFKTWIHEFFIAYVVLLSSLRFSFEFYNFSTFWHARLHKSPYDSSSYSHFERKWWKNISFALSQSHPIYYKGRGICSRALVTKDESPQKSIVFFGWNYDLLAAKSVNGSINWMNYCNETMKNEKQLTRLFLRKIWCWLIN